MITQNYKLSDFQGRGGYANVRKIARRDGYKIVKYLFALYIVLSNDNELLDAIDAKNCARYAKGLLQKWSKLNIPFG